MPAAKEILLFDINPRSFAQERARKTYEALIVAASEVFVTRGFDATQTPDIAAQAGVSVGTFYRYFADKREIFLEMLRRELARSYREVMSRLTPDAFIGRDARATIETALGVLIENVTRHPGMQKMFLEMSLRDDDVAALKRVFDDEARRSIADLISAICPDELVADPEATAYVIHTAVVQCATHIAGAHGPPPIDRDRALKALTLLLYRALFGIDS